MTSLPLENQKRKIALAAYLFHGIVAVIILIGANIPPVPDLPPALLQDLFRGTDKNFVPFGSEFKPFEPLLPPGEKVSFVMDFPYHPYGQTVQDLYTAQSYLVPRIVSLHTKERAAIVYCSSAEKADKRLKETGYRLLVPLGDGKGVAAKL